MITHEITLDIILIGVLRIIALIPAGLILYSVFKTYINKFHSINGLMKTRFSLLVFFLSIFLDNLYFSYRYLIAFFITGKLQMDSFFIFFDKFIGLIAIFFMYLLFKEGARTHHDKKIDNHGN